MKVIIKKIVRLVELVTRTQISIKRIMPVRIKVHPNAVNDGHAMYRYVDLVRRFCAFKPQNVFEIGANYGQDAEMLRKNLGVDATEVHIFEPHPQIIKAVRELYGFQCHELAVSNTSGRAVFHAIDIENNEYRNTGISSLKEGLTTDKRNFIDIDVKVVRMDDFVRRHNIEHIDFLKIDVEGANYEVLEGFGEELSRVKAIQVEGEYKQYWEGQKLFWDIAQLLRAHDFELVDFVLSGDGIQSDSFWVQKKYLVQVN